MNEYFRVLGTIPAQLRSQVRYLVNKELTEAVQELLNVADQIEKLIQEITGFLMTDVFKKIKNLEHKMEYQVREFLKDIDIYFQKLVIQFITELAEKIGLALEAINIPIPFIKPVTLLDENGVAYEYQPRVFDLFTKEGKTKVKAAIAENLEDVLSALSKFDDKIALFFTGKLNLRIPEYSAEEIWQKIMAWVQKTITNWISAFIDAIRNLPIIKQILGVLEILQDPTVALQEAMDKLWDQAIKLAEKSVKEAIDFIIDKILNFPIPIFGTLGQLMEFDIKEEYKKFKVHMKELVLTKIHDMWHQLMDKIRKFFITGWIQTLYDLLMKIAGNILKKFPILKEIIAGITLIINVLTGNVKVCQVVQIILPVIFDLFGLVYKLIPSSIFEIVYTEYGYEPGGKITPPFNAVTA